MLSKKLFWGIVIVIVIVLSQLNFMTDIGEAYDKLHSAPYGWDLPPLEGYEKNEKLLKFLTEQSMEIDIPFEDAQEKYNLTKKQWGDAYERKKYSNPNVAIRKKDGMVRYLSPHKAGFFAGYEDTETGQLVTLVKCLSLAEGHSDIDELTQSFQEKYGFGTQRSPLKNMRTIEYLIDDNGRNLMFWFTVENFSYDYGLKKQTIIFIELFDATHETQEFLKRQKEEEQQRQKTTDQLKGSF